MEAQEKIIIFIAVPKKEHADRYDCWCNDPIPNTPARLWQQIVMSQTLDYALATVLHGATLRRDGTSYRVAVLKKFGTAWQVDKFLGSDTPAASCEGGRVLCSMWNENPHFLSSRWPKESDAPVPAPEPPAQPPCIFCKTPSVAGAGTFPACMTHLHPAALHAERLHVGGAVDCFESRAETLRFWVAQNADAAFTKAQLVGFRTQMDAVPHPKTRTSLSRPSPSTPEEIPLAGTTPHYEWP